MTESTLQSGSDLKERSNVRAIVDGRTLEQWPQDLYIPPEALEVVLEIGRAHV